MWGISDRTSTSTSPPADHARTTLDCIPFFTNFASKAEFLSYVLLFLVKMPFPPVNRPKSFSGSIKKKLLCQSSSFTVGNLDQNSSWNDQLKRLDKKATQLKSKLPTRCIKAGRRLEAKSAWISTPHPVEVSSTSGTSFTETSFDKNASATSSKKSKSPSSKSATISSPSLSKDSHSSPASSGCSGSRNRETNVGFSVSLTPEAVLLLQKRNREKQLRKAAVQLQEQAPKRGSRSNNPLVKISLLNDDHRYDDVEYEAVEQVVDHSVVLKCAEWLRGVEKAAGVGKLVKSSQKSV